MVVRIVKSAAPVQITNLQVKVAIKVLRCTEMQAISMLCRLDHMGQRKIPTSVWCLRFVSVCAYQCSKNILLKQRLVPDIPGLWLHSTAEGNIKPEAVLAVAMDAWLVLLLTD